MEITIPEFAIVLLIGPSGSGKSTFASKHFSANEVLSERHFLEMAGYDGNRQAIADASRSLMAQMAQLRLQQRKTVVVDAELLSQDQRREWWRLAKKHHVRAVALLFDIPAQACIDRNAVRTETCPTPAQVRAQSLMMERTPHFLSEEGFKTQHRISAEVDMDEILLRIRPQHSNFRHVTGPMDIIGDVHGCFSELASLLDCLGYEVRSLSTDLAVAPNFQVSHPDGRQLVFVGDYCDRGPDTPRVYRLVMDVVASGMGFCVPGNHDDKFLRWLRGNSVQPKHGLDKTIQQFETAPEAFKEQVRAFIDRLPSHLEMDGGRLVVAHAGLKEAMHGRSSGEVHAFCLYGETTGETDEFGLPVRHNWAGEYEGEAWVVYGHTPVPEPVWQKNTVNIDTGCVFGGKLSALRYPEREVVSVPAEQVYSTPVRPLHWNVPKEAQAMTDPSMPLQMVSARALISTRHGYHLTPKETEVFPLLRHTVLETVAPQWMIYLPPSLSPVTSSTVANLLEHPAQGFDYYRKKGQVELRARMWPVGTRAVVVVCRKPSVATTRFELPQEADGAVFTRTGRPYFADEGTERDFLRRIAAGLEEAEIWQMLQSNWVCLDVIMDGAATDELAFRNRVLRPVVDVGRHGLAVAQAQVQAAMARGLDLSVVAARMDGHAQALEAFRGMLDRLPPQERAVTAHLVRIVAAEGKVWVDGTREAQDLLSAKLLEALPGIFKPLDYRMVDLDLDSSQRDCVAWWEDMAGTAVEGMVLEPLEFTHKKSEEMSQPGLKVRTPEYLRLLYGPAYDSPENLTILRERSLKMKRESALRQHSLGMEAVLRFVERQNWHDVHSCIFTLLTIETANPDVRL